MTEFTASRPRKLAASSGRAKPEAHSPPRRSALLAVAHPLPRAAPRQRRAAGPALVRRLALLRRRLPVGDATATGALAPAALARGRGPCPGLRGALAGAAERPRDGGGSAHGAGRHIARDLPQPHRHRLDLCPERGALVSAGDA